MPSIPSLTKHPKKKPTPVASAPAAPLRWYRVQEDRQVPRPGSGTTLLRAGKEINSANFSIKAITDAGAKLTEIEAPSWYVAAQERGIERHAELVEAGADLGDPAPYEPVPLRKEAHAAIAPSA